MVLRLTCLRPFLENNMAEETLTPPPAVETPPVTTPPAPVVQQVTIPAETLERILKQLDDNAAEMKILRQAASTSRLTQAENKNKPKELPLGYLKVLNGKTVISWKSAKAETLRHPQNPDMVVGEVLKAVYYFLEGGDSGIVDQVDFTRCEDRVTFRFLDGKDVLKTPGLKEVRVKCESLITSDGNDELKASYKVPAQEFNININFINP